MTDEKNKKQASEKEAIQAVLDAEKEPGLEGDLNELAEKF